MMAFVVSRLNVIKPGQDLAIFLLLILTLQAKVKDEMGIAVSRRQLDGLPEPFLRLARLPHAQGDSTPLHEGRNPLAFFGQQCIGDFPRGFQLIQILPTPRLAKKDFQVARLAAVQNVILSHCFSNSADPTEIVSQAQPGFVQLGM
jgi:hypothetical protein